MRKAKHVHESETSCVHIILNSHINGYGRLFGGQLISWVDTLAGVVARRHSECEVTTLCIDSVQFKKPAKVDGIVELRGKITWVGKTSMEVRVDSFVEYPFQEYRELINTAFLVFVALDENEHTKVVPQLILETNQQRIEFEKGEKRQGLRKDRMYEGY